MIRSPHRNPTTHNPDLCCECNQRDISHNEQTMYKKYVGSKRGESGHWVGGGGPSKHEGTWVHSGGPKTWGGTGVRCMVAKGRRWGHLEWGSSET